MAEKKRGASSRAKIGSELDLPRPDIRVHVPVAHQAVERAFEAGGFVLFKAEVAQPRKAVAAQQRIHKVLGLARGQQHHQAQQAQGGAHKVQAAAGGIAVLAQVKRVELGKALKAARVHRGVGGHGGSGVDVASMFLRPGMPGKRVCPRGSDAADPVEVLGVNHPAPFVLHDVQVVFHDVVEQAQAHFQHRHGG